MQGIKKKVMENAVMQEEMIFELKPTLQHRAMVKIVIEMWMQEDVVALMPEMNLYYPKLEDEMEVIINMRQKVKNLRLSELLKDELSAVIKPVGTQIIQWFQYLSHHFHLNRINPKKLRWTPQGTIDKKESVRALVRDQRLEVVKRYYLACKFCLIEEIGDLLKQLPKVNGLNLDLDIGGELVIFWTYYLGEGIHVLIELLEMYEDPHVTPGLFAFEAAILSYNSVAAKYLFEKLLHPIEKDELIRYTRRALKRFSVFPDCDFNGDNTPSEFFPDFLCSALSIMDRDQQMEIFERRPKTVLQCFLTWPYQSLFVEAAKRVWKSINKDSFNSILFEIFGKIDHGCKVCVYRKIFCQFWELSSVEYRKYVIGDYSFTNNLYDILENGEVGICRMILADADAAEKEKFVWGERFEAILFYKKIINNECWNILKFFLKACAPSKEKLVEVKSLMIDFNCLEVNEKQTREFVQILDSFLSDQPR